MAEEVKIENQEVIVPEGDVAPAPAPVPEEVAAEAAPAVAEEEVKEGSSEGSSLDGLRKVVAEKFGKEFGSDEELCSFISEKIDELGNYQNGDKKIEEILTEYPELYAVVEDLGAGKPLEVALASNIDVEALKPEDGEDMYGDYEEAKKKFAEKRAEKEAAKKAYDENIATSNQIVKDYFDEKEMDDDSRAKFSEFVDEKVGEYLDGKFTKDFLDVFFKGMHYDEDLAKAREEGAIEGKNSAVDAKRITVLEETDGMPDAGGGVEPAEEPEVDDSVFGEIKRARKHKGVY